MNIEKSIILRHDVDRFQRNALVIMNFRASVEEIMN